MLWEHRGLVHFRIPAPFFLAGACIQGEDHAPIRDAIQRAVPDQRSRFLIAAALADVVGPSQAEPAHIRRVDLFERTVAGFGEILPVAQPVGPIRCGILQNGVVHVHGLLG